MMTWHLSLPQLLALWAMASPLVTHAFAPPTPLSYRAPVTTNNHRLSAVALPSVPNPFKKLPWNVAKERERQRRRFQMERAKLHRELGIPPDASYEEIVQATDMLIASCGGNLKRKVKIEIAKDKILQIRLSERLAGLAEIDEDAVRQSNVEKYGEEEEEESDDKEKKKKIVETAVPWSQGLIVKPDKEHALTQAKLWSIVTAVGVLLPTTKQYLAVFSWLLCFGQLMYRGMPKEQRDMEGMSMAERGIGGHRKLSFLIAFTTWLVGSLLINALTPSSWKAQRWSGNVSFSMMNVIFAVVCSYLQPYKGRL